MSKLSIDAKIFLIALGIFLFGGIIFAVLSFIDYSLILGWIIGAGSSMLTFLSGVFVIKILLKQGIKWKGVLYNSVRIFFVFIFHIIIIFLIIYIDKEKKGLDFWDKDIKSVLTPINTLTYLSGVGVIAISTFVAHFSFKRGAKYGQIRRRLSHEGRL